MLSTQNILSGFLGNGTSTAVDVSALGIYKSIHASITEGSATVTIQVSNLGGEDWLTIADFSVATAKPDGFADALPWRYMRAVVAASSGLVTVVVGG